MRCLRASCIVIKTSDVDGHRRFYTLILHCVMRSCRDKAEVCDQTTAALQKRAMPPYIDCLDDADKDQIAEHERQCEHVKEYEFLG